MAVLNITDQRVTVELGWWEKLAARRSHLTVPRRAIESVQVVEDASDAAGWGRRVSATRVRGLTFTGTISTEDGTRLSSFLVCHRRGPGIVLQLRNATLDRIVISTPAAYDYAARLGAMAA